MALDRQRGCSAVEIKMRFIGGGVGFVPRYDSLLFWVNVRGMNRGSTTGLQPWRYQHDMSM